METRVWIIRATVILALVSMLVTHLSAVAIAVLILAVLATAAIFERAERYMPGGQKNPYCADTVTKPNFGRKVLVGSSAILGAVVIWILAIWVARNVS